jgi:hypothetical protein
VLSSLQPDTKRKSASGETLLHNAKAALSDCFSAGFIDAVFEGVVSAGSPFK